MGLMNTIRAGGVLASELGIPAYTKRNAYKLAGMAAGVGVAGYSAHNARRNGVSGYNATGMIAGAGLAAFSARGTGIKSMMTMAGRKQAASTIRNGAMRSMTGLEASSFGRARKVANAGMFRAARGLESIPGPRTAAKGVGFQFRKGAAMAGGMLGNSGGRAMSMSDLDGMGSVEARLRDSIKNMGR